MNPKPIDPASPAAMRLIAMSDAYMGALYPADSNHLVSVQALKDPSVHFAGIEHQGQLLACGAVRTMHDDVTYGEIKRVFVPAEHRGRGYASLIMRHLEDHMRATGIRIARLETGILQPEALALYRKLGYRDRGPFGDYALDPLSVFMEKAIEG